MKDSMTWHVQPAAHQRDPFVMPPRPCPVCSLDLSAGYGRHPTCDPRWLQPASSATGSAGNAHKCAVESGRRPAELPPDRDA